MKFSNKVSYFILSFFVFAIIVSFALTGFSGFNSSGGNVASVNGTPVTLKEFNNIYQRKLDQYSQIFGGKSLTTAQIKQFRIKESTLSELVNQKLLLNYASSLGLDASDEELKEEIKELPYFKTNDKFDVNKYRALLRSNNFSPAEFEQVISDDLKNKKLSYFYNTLSTSKAYAKEVLQLKQTKASAQVVTIDKEDLEQFIVVSDKEINDFIADESKKSVLETLYNSKKDIYQKPEQVKARHILLKTQKDDNKVLNEIKSIRKKVNPKNFATMAKQYTQEASGKSSGGSLGWFGKGKMVPDFEKVAFKLKKGEISDPVKTQFGYHIIYVEDKKKAQNTPLEQVKNQLTKEHLRKTKREQLNQIFNDLSNKVSSALANNDLNQIKKLEKEGKLSFEENKQLNMYDASIDGAELENQDLKKIFKNKDIAQTFKQQKGTSTLLFKVTQVNEASEITNNLDQELKELNNNLRSSFQQSSIKQLEEKSSVITYPGVL